MPPQSKAWEISNVTTDVSPYDWIALFPIRMTYVNSSSVDRCLRRLWRNPDLLDGIFTFTTRYYRNKSFYMQLITLK